VELGLHSPISLHGVVLSEAQGQLCLYLNPYPNGANITGATETPVTTDRILTVCV